MMYQYWGENARIYAKNIQFVKVHNYNGVPYGYTISYRASEGEGYRCLRTYGEYERNCVGGYNPVFTSYIAIEDMPKAVRDFCRPRAPQLWDDYSHDGNNYTVYIYRK